MWFVCNPPLSSYPLNEIIIRYKWKNMLFSADIYIFNMVSAEYSQVFIIFAAVIKKCNIQNEVTMDDLFRE